MAFWSTKDTEPKRNFRFKVSLSGDVQWWAKSVSLPSWDVSEVEHNYLDNKYYFPGRVTWNDVSLTLVDPISVDAVTQTNDLLIGQNYVVKNDGTYKTITHAPTGSLPQGGIDVKIEVLDASGAPVETWDLHRAFVKSAKFGDLDYSSDDLKTVEMTFRYDWATCLTGTATQFAPA